MNKKMITSIIAAAAMTLSFAAVNVGAEAETSPDGLHASIQRVTDAPEWIVNIPQAQDEAVKQLFVVDAMSMETTTASVYMFERDEAGAWKQILSTPGFVGKNGLCADADHKEGCGQTPVGTYTFNKAFGIAGDPGCAIPYVQVDDDTYWSGDDREGMHYNEMVNIQDYPDLNMENSEHIVEYEYQYQYCLNISFNEDGTAGRGSAIFLHCFGPFKPYTGGCVAIPENIMKLVMQKVSPDCVVVIDIQENLEKEAEPTATPTATPEATATPTATPEVTATPTAAPEATATPTATPVPEEKTEPEAEPAEPEEPAEQEEPAEPEVPAGPVPTDKTETAYFLNGNTTTLTEYSDGNLYSDDGVLFFSNGSGTYSGVDGSTLYTQMPDPVSGTQHGLVSQGSGRPVLIILNGDTFKDPDGNVYTEQEDGTFVADNGDLYNVEW